METKIEWECVGGRGRAREKDAGIHTFSCHMDQEVLLLQADAHKHTQTPRLRNVVLCVFYLQVE